MKPQARIHPRWSALAVATGLAAWLCAVPVAAQGSRPSEGSGPTHTPGGGGSSGGGAASGGSGGGGGSSTASGGGGSASSGGGSSNGGGSSGGGGIRSESGGGGRFGATGSTGYAAPRGGDRGTRSGGGSGSGSTAAGNGTADRAPVSGTGTSDRAVRRGDGSGRTQDAIPDGTGGGVPAYARPRDGREPIGTAVPRGSVPSPGGGGGGIIIPGGYYGGYYDPWWYGAGYVGDYGGYYDPWYGGYPSYSQPSYSSSYYDEGAVRLKIKPRHSEVFVDGFFVGTVDDFDGIFQRLHLETGAHRIEVRAQGYEPLAFDVRITPDHTTTYQGEMKRIQ